MAGYFNKVVLMGNLVRDPELRYTPQGTAVTDIRLAINDTRSRDKEKAATFVDVTMWDRAAEVVCEYMHKGSSILVEGRLVTDTWEDRESGRRMSKLKVVAQNFQFTDSRSGGSSSSSRRFTKPRQDEDGYDDTSSPKRSAPPQDNFGGGFAEEADDIPF